MLLLLKALTMTDLFNNKTINSSPFVRLVDRFLIVSRIISWFFCLMKNAGQPFYFASCKVTAWVYRETCSFYFWHGHHVVDSSQTSPGINWIGSHCFCTLALPFAPALLNLDARGLPCPKSDSEWYKFWLWASHCTGEGLSDTTLYYK